MSSFDYSGFCQGYREGRNSESVGDIQNLPVTFSKTKMHDRHSQKDSTMGARPQSVNRRDVSLDSYRELAQLPVYFGNDQVTLNKRALTTDSMLSLQQLESDFMPTKSRDQTRDQSTVNKNVRSAESRDQISRLPALNHVGTPTYNNSGNYYSGTLANAPELRNSDYAYNNSALVPTNSSYAYNWRNADRFGAPQQTAPNNQEFFTQNQSNLGGNQTQLSKSSESLANSDYAYNDKNAALWPTNSSYAYTAPRLGASSSYYLQPGRSVSQSTMMDHAEIPNLFDRMTCAISAAPPVMPQTKTLNKHAMTTTSAMDIRGLPVRFPDVGQFRITAEYNPTRTLNKNLFSPDSLYELKNVPPIASESDHFVMRDYSVQSLEDLRAIPSSVFNSESYMPDTPTTDVLTARNISDSHLSQYYPVAYGH